MTAMGSVMLFLTLSSCMHTESRSASLVLEETAAVSLPANLTALALLPLRDGTLFVVPEDAPVLALGPGDSITEFPVRVGRQFLALRQGHCGRCVTLLAKTGSEIVEVDAVTSRITGRWTTGQLNLEWLAATWSDKRWVVAGSEGGNRAILLVLEQDSSVTVLGARTFEPPPAVSSDSNWIPAVRLAASGEQVVLTAVEPPHQTFVMRSDGTPILSLVPSYHQLVMEQRPSTATKVTLATYWLSSGYLQILADLASDYRELHLYSPGGRWMRAQSITAPWGPAHADIDQSQLLVLRGVSPLEAVYYHWRWTEGGI